MKKYFGMRVLGAGNASLMVMLDEDGFVLTLMKAGRTSPVAYPGNFQIDFFVENEVKVDTINRRLKDHGYRVALPERLHAYTFYIEAPGGFTIELGA